MRNGNSATVAYLAIGSNLGDRARHCYDAVAMLSTHPEITLTKVSRLIETAPVGGPADASPFLNGAIEVTTTLGSHALLAELSNIEKLLGREAGERWAPRVMDLDLLLYGERIISSDDLIVPHPMMHQRRFVLEPLAAIAPDVVHPTLQMTVQGLLDSLENMVAQERASVAV